MKDSTQKLTRHRRIHRRLDRRRNTLSVNSWTEKRQRRSGFAEALKDGELHLFKPRKGLTFHQRMSWMMIEDQKSFREYWKRKQKKKSQKKSPVPTELKAKHIEEEATTHEQKSKQKSFFQKMKTGIRNLMQRKSGQK